ncbi:hypothetical protein HHK36_024632 [Tetracentron sinense]|uniref:Uncharacterized protein n=1 Tax=Tetracentron sinense TaxID=13715 RepID=A0A834YLA0_TETSI|nr:hypothetical protein HHK36_024632 [Tetracentron sinense]
MAQINGTLRQTLQHHTLESVLTAIDSKPLILPRNSSSLRANLLQSNTTSLTIKRGPRYQIYAELRESKLRMKNKKQQLHEPGSTMMPPNKRVTFQGQVPVSGSNRTSVVARSVLDFSVALRKENRRLGSMLEMAPPPSKASKGGLVSKLGGSKSANGGEKRGGGVMVRKSCASFEELKGLSSAAASAINGENKGGRTSRAINKTVLSYRQY